MEISLADSGLFFYGLGCSVLPGRMLLLGAGQADQESPGVTRGAFLQESHQYEESLGAGPNQSVFSGAQTKIGKKKMQISQEWARQSFV